MKKYLIVQTKRFGDIFQAAHLISSITDEGHSVSLLCFKEFSKAAECLNGVDEIFTIDRKKILSFYKNHIYPDGIALEEFFQNLSQMRDQKFDYIVNLSNDRISTTLSSFLGAKAGSRVLGQRINRSNNIESSHFWSLIFNEVLTSFKASPYHTRDVFHKIAELKTAQATLGSDSLKFDQESEETVQENFKQLRETKQSHKMSSIVAIQLTASMSSKEIPLDQIIKTVTSLQESSNLIPVLLIAPNAKERQLCHQINQSLSEPIMSIESDFKALISVLRHVDLLITPDTAIKHMADLVQTQTLEVSLGNSPALLQGTVNTKSVILSKAFSKRQFRIKDLKEDLNSCLYSDILNSVDYLLNDAELSLSKDWGLFKPCSVNDGIVYLPLTHGFDLEFHLTQISSRMMLQQITSHQIDCRLCHFISGNYNKKDVYHWISAQKEQTISFSKALLKTLKSTIQAQSDSKNVQHFVASLDELLAFTESSELIGINALIFRGRLEGLTSRNLKENLKEVESLLYELKDFVQALLFSLRAIEIAYDEKDTQKIESRLRAFQVTP